MSEIFEQQMKVIISLLARSSLGIEKIETIVRSGKRKGKPDDFVLAYNALDGTKTGAEIAQIVGITQQGMSSVLQTWEDEGIVYKEDKTGKYYSVLKLPLKVKQIPRSSYKRIKKLNEPKGKSNKVTEVENGKN